METKFVQASELLLKDSFVEQLKKAEKDEDVQKLFAENGVELSLEDIALMCKESCETWADKELGEDDLDNVAGGILLTGTAIAGFAFGAANLAFYVSYAYHSIKGSKKGKKK